MKHTEENHTPRRGYSIKRTAELLDLSERTVRQRIAEGQIHAPLVSTRKRTVPDTEIARLLKDGI